MMPSQENDSKHWHDKAARMRAMASEMSDSEVQILMLDLAETYDTIGMRAAAQTNTDKR